MTLPGVKLFDLTGRVAIVTGGSKGLGKAMAAGLASAGASIVLASRNESELNAAVRAIEADYNTACHGVMTDVVDQSQTEHLAAETLAKFGRIDVLVNSAGINIRGPIDEISLDQFREVQRVNVEGTWLACRAVLPAMKQSGSGRIINLASTLGLVGLANRTPYTSSKGAVVQMTRALALELAVSDADERTDCGQRRGEKVYRRCRGTESLGPTRGNPRGRDLSCERCVQLYHWQHDGCRRWLDDTVNGICKSRTCRCTKLHAANCVDVVDGERALACRLARLRARSC
jgi:NADP-dependent 3-hydroxy acid dehydrogenase YdfG